MSDNDEAAAKINSKGDELKALIEKRKTVDKKNKDHVRDISKKLMRNIRDNKRMKTHVRKIQS